MVIGNEVTLYMLSRTNWSRYQPQGVQGRILQEANASGKARGYADVKTILEKVKRQVAIEEQSSRINATPHGVSDEKKLCFFCCKTRMYQAWSV